MSAVLTPAFGDRRAIRTAEVGNAAYDRAIKLGYSRIAALQFSRKAKSSDDGFHRPAEIALVVVPPKQHSAMVRGPYDGGRAA